MCMLLLQLCPTLCNPIDSSPPGSSVHEIFQARILEWVPCPLPGDLPHPGIEPLSPASQADSLLLSHQWTPKFIKQYKIISTYKAGDPSSKPGLGRSSEEGTGYPLQYSWVCLKSCLQWGKPGFNPWVGKIPWKRAWQPFHGVSKSWHNWVTKQRPPTWDNIYNIYIFP